MTRKASAQNYIRKQDLRTGGPRRLTIAAVAQVDGLPRRDGQPVRKQLELQFTDETRLSLRTQTNLKRIVGAFGDRTSHWVGRVIEVYFSPDVANPAGGEPGGIRVRVPEPADTTRTAESFVSDLG